MQSFTTQTCLHIDIKNVEYVTALILYIYRRNRILFRSKNFESELLNTFEIDKKSFLTIIKAYALLIQGEQATLETIKSFLT